MTDHDPWSKKSISAGLFVQIVGGIIAALIVAYILGASSSGGGRENNVDPTTTAAQPNGGVSLFNKVDSFSTAPLPFRIGIVGMILIVIGMIIPKKYDVGVTILVIGGVIGFFGAIWYFIQYNPYGL
jgi:hypothetical protein